MKKYLFIISILIFVACWDKQDNQVTEPETPNYTFSGTVLDMDSSEPLAGISMAITYWDLSYPVEFKPDTYLTNDQGQFLVENLVVGNYEFTFYRDGFPVLIYNYSQGYQERNITFKLPTVYVVEKVFTNYSKAKFSVFDSTENEEIHGLALIDTDNGAEDNLFQFELVLSNWGKTDSWKLPINFNDIGLVNLCYGSNTSNFFLMHLADANLYNLVIDDQRIRIANQKTLSFSGLDVFWWNNLIYISANGMVGVYDTDTLQLQQELLFTKSNAWLTSICRDSSYFWITDINEQYLYQCDLNLNIIKTYAPFYSSDRVTILDMSMDAAGNIWFVIRG
ncbi:MAG: carboxypeptidase regulatory-like domain-containing protein [Candidatus Marinimicrobia bacterium]|nr:carboxypeptidase regulatory-like domain-containing protein [Candidatus Neomarinimicrobiota bacterium]